MAQEVIHLSTVTSETRENLLNTKEDNKKKRKEGKKSEKSEKAEAKVKAKKSRLRANQAARADFLNTKEDGKKKRKESEKSEKSEKAETKAKAKKSRPRANQAARADGKGKGKAIQIEPDWKSRSQILINKVFGPKNDEGDDEDPDAPTQYTMAKLLNTISKHRIALPEEARPNKPSSSETPFPYPDNFINDFVLAFERSTPGGTKEIRDLESHLWKHEGELGRILDLFDLDFSHRQTHKFDPFTQAGTVKRKLFRMTSLPPNVLRQIFKHVLVPANVVIPYRYHADPILRSLLHATGALAKPDTNVLVAFCSRNRAIAAVCDEARNVLYNDNTFLFRDPRDYIHFVGAIGWENLTRLNSDRNILFSHDFFLRADEDESLWLSTAGQKAASDMLGLRSWSGGWDEVEGADPTRGERAEGPVWDEGEASGYGTDGRDTATAEPPAADIGRAITTSYTRPYSHITEGAHFSARNMYHVNRVDRHRAPGGYNDKDGMGWYHVEYWKEKKCFYRWYEDEMVGKGTAAAAGKEGGRRVGRERASVRLGLRERVSSEGEREQLRRKGRERRERMEEEERRRGVGREWRLADVEEGDEEEEGERPESPVTVVGRVEEEEEGGDGEEERPESPVTVLEVGGDEVEANNPHDDAMIEYDDHDDSASSTSSTSTIIEGWSTWIEDEILALMEQTRNYP